MAGWLSKTIWKFRFELLVYPWVSCTGSPIGAPPRLDNLYILVKIKIFLLGQPGYPLRKIVNEIERAGFQIHRSYRAFEHPYHRFIILEKAKEER